MLKMLDPTDNLATEIKLLISKGDNAEQRAEEYYKEAGRRLAELKEKTPDDMTWEDYVMQKCSIGRRRADDLISLSEGRTTLAQLRGKNKEANRRLRKRQSASRDADDATEPIIQERKINALEYAKDHVAELMKALKQSLNKDEWRALVEWIEKEKGKWQRRPTT